MRHLTDRGGRDAWTKASGDHVDRCRARGARTPGMRAQNGRRSCGAHGWCCWQPCGTAIRLSPSEWDVEAVGLWRWNAWRGVPLAEVSVAKRLADAPRPGVQPRLTTEQVCQILALACEQPSGSGRPISH